MISHADRSQLSELKELTATVVRMDEKSALTGSKFILKTGAQESLLKLQKIDYVVNPLAPEERNEASKVALNDIVRLELKLSQPVFMDRYAVNKKNGAFILIDPQTNATVAVGFVD